jgi:hypothetical protein
MYVNQLQLAGKRQPKEYRCHNTAADSCMGAAAVTKQTVQCAQLGLEADS